MTAFRIGSGLLVITTTLGGLLSSPSGGLGVSDLNAMPCIGQTDGVLHECFEVFANVESVKFQIKLYT